MQGIATQPMAETLLKARQYAALRALVREERCLSSYWPSLKICIRNGYVVKDFTMWVDYHNLLQRFHLDTRNAAYVCPPNLRHAHDTLLERARRKRAKEEAIRQRMQAEERVTLTDRRMRDIEEFQEAYQAQKSRFFDLRIRSNKLTVVVLKTVGEFKVEADKLGHCLFTNEYYKKHNSLILSARLNDSPGEPVETVEVLLNTLEISQSRGLRNGYSKHHDSVVELVRRSIPEIAARMVV